MKILIIITMFVTACAPSLPTPLEGREGAEVSKSLVSQSGGLEKGVNRDGSHYAIWHH